MKFYLLVIILILSFNLNAQIKVLFDASKAETAGNADWIIDANNFNIGYWSGPPIFNTGNEANAQQFPTPSQSNITNSTLENYWKGGLSAWAIDLVKKGYEVSTLSIGADISYQDNFNPEDLTNYDIFVICEPNILFTNAQKSAILNFVQNGGGLFMISDHDTSDRNNDGYDSVDIWNDLMNNNDIENNPFGIQFNYNWFTEASSNIANLPNNDILHGENGEVSKVEFYGGTDMTLNPTANPSVKGLVYRFTSANSGNNNVLIAQSHYGNGKIVAVGDSSPFDDGTGDNNDFLYDGYIEDANGNHRRMILNATDWLAESITSNNNPHSIIHELSIINTWDSETFTINLTNHISDKKFSFIVFDALGRKIHQKDNLSINTDYQYQKKHKGFHTYICIINDAIVAKGKMIF